MGEDKRLRSVGGRVVKALRAWSPSVSTASGYLAIFTAAASVATFTGNLVYDLSKEVYWISEEHISREQARILSGISLDTELKEYELKYPRIKTIVPNEFARSVNDKLVSLSLSMLRPESYSHTVDYRVTLDSGGMLSIVMRAFVYYDRALNPSESIFSFNVDMRRGNYIDLFDIFRGGYQAIDAVKQVLRPYVDEKCDSVFDIAYYDDEFVPRFALHDEYIEFIFSEYEVAPGFCGAFSALVPYQEFSRLIDYGGPLADKAYPVGAWNAEERRWELLNKLMSQEEGQ